MAPRLGTVSFSYDDGPRRPIARPRTLPAAEERLDSVEMLDVANGSRIPIGIEIESAELCLALEWGAIRVNARRARSALDEIEK